MILGFGTNCGGRKLLVGVSTVFAAACALALARTDERPVESPLVAVSQEQAGEASRPVFCSDDSGVVHSRGQSGFGRCMAAKEKEQAGKVAESSR